MGQVDLDNIAVLLRQFRRRVGLKQEALAEHLCVSQGYYSRLENGRLSPSPEVHDRITALLSSSVFENVAVRWRKSVQHSYLPVSMIYADHGTVKLLEFSRGFRAMGGIYATGQTGEVLENVLGEDADRHFSELKALGAFDGALTLVRNIWATQGAEQNTFFKAVTTVLPDETYGFILHSQHSQISEREYNSYDPREHISVIER